MRIALISTPFVPVPPTKYGGTELVVATLAEKLAERGHDVVLYATGDSRVDGVEIRYAFEEAVWPPDPWHELNHATFAMRDILSRDDIDVIHAHVSPAVALSAFVDVPMLFTLHHVYDARLHELYRANESRSVTLVAISERQRELLGHGLQARVVHHGLKPELYPLGRGGNHAAFIGRFALEKGVHVAIDIARRARTKIRVAGMPHWKDEPYYQAEVQHRLRQPHVTWLGEAAHPDKVRLLCGAVATLFPIDWEEPFGLVMIESMLCGTPVISFARGAAPEVIDEDVTGWAVADQDEMLWRLRQLASGRTRFNRARCRERAVARFSADRMVDGYLGLYAAALGRSSDDHKVLQWPAS